MSEKRMTFTAAMVQAFLLNRKIQTRRVWPIQPGLGNDAYVKFDPKTCTASWPGESEFDSYTVKSRYQVGDLIWISESTWESPKGIIAYRASIPERPAPDWKLRTGRFMFKKDARIWREVTAVRAQRVQDISEEDARAEGIRCSTVWYQSGKTAKEQKMLVCVSGVNRDRRGYGSAIPAFAALWNSLHAKDHPWASRPWVFAYTLRPAAKPE